MSELVIEIITYVIIYFIVGAVGRKISKAQQKRVVPQECEDYLDMKAYSKILLYCAVLFTIIIVIMGILPSNVTGKTKHILAVIGILFTILVYLFSYGLGLWYIAVKKDSIETCSLFGKKKSILLSEITNAKRDSNHNIYLYIGEKNVFIFDNQFDEKKIVEVLGYNNIQIVDMCK